VTRGEMPPEPTPGELRVLRAYLEADPLYPADFMAEHVTERADRTALIVAVLVLLAVVVLLRR
jgi:hypothetical protein